MVSPKGYRALENEGIVQIEFKKLFEQTIILTVIESRNCILTHAHWAQIGNSPPPHSAHVVGVQADTGSRSPEVPPAPAPSRDEFLHPSLGFEEPAWVSAHWSFPLRRQRPRQRTWTVWG